MTGRSPLIVELIAMLLLVGCRSSADGPPFSKVSFSPNGKQVVFAHREGDDCFLYLGDIATQTATRVTKARSGCENDPAFSRDGKLIAYSYAPRGERKSSLFVVNGDGSNARPVTKSGTDEVYPVFSGDGRLIYFARSGRFGHSSPVAASRQHDFDLFSVDLSSSAVAQLTQQSLYDLQSVDLSPDGESLMISTTRYPIGALIEMYKIAGTQSAWKVFQPHVPNEPIVSGPAPYFGNACYLQDGLGMLVLAASNKGGGNYSYNVYKVNTVTGSLEGQITNLSGVSTGVQASPDGKILIVNNQDSMYLFNQDTHELKPLQWKGVGG